MPEQPFAIPAAAFFLLAIPLVLGVVPRNRYYGVRTARTLSDDRAWYGVNRVAGLAVMVASGVYWAVAFTLPYQRSASNNFSIWAVHLAAFVLPILIGLGGAVRYGSAR